jgi:hypothetical protein
LMTCHNSRAEIPMTSQNTTVFTVEFTKNSYSIPRRRRKCQHTIKVSDTPKSDALG